MFIRDADDRQQRRQFTRRGLLLGAAQVGLLGALAARLHQLQVVESVIVSCELLSIASSCRDKSSASANEIKASAVARSSVPNVASIMSDLDIQRR